jgi:2-polyprenyl-6-methoxyphenol hydroxylase-like FAD-dependent oxidoreductase
MMLAGMQGFRELFAGANPAKKLLRDIGLKLADTLRASNLNSFVRRWVLTIFLTGYVKR